MQSFAEVKSPTKIDGNLLRRENWGHGARPVVYQSVNQTAFTTPNRTVNMHDLKQQIDQVKERVSGVSVSYKMGRQDPNSLALNF